MGDDANLAPLRKGAEVLGQVAVGGNSNRGACPDSALPLRERKKLRFRRTLTDTALRLFLDEGFRETTLERLVDEAEVSMRTFFRYFSSKEAVAMAAEEESWDAYLTEISRSEIHGTVLTALWQALVAALQDMGEDWERRFMATRGLAARTSELREYSALSTFRTQHRLVEELEDKLGIDGREEVRLRLVCEFALSAWRCGAKNWIRSGKHRPDPGKRSTLIRRIEETFDAIPASLTLSAPASQRPATDSGREPPADRYRVAGPGLAGP